MGRIIPLVFFLSATAIPALATPISMSDLVGGKTITCGNLKFSKFEYSRDDVPGFAAASGVSVDCTTFAGMTGISVTGPWSYALMDGRLPTGKFAYLVTVLEGGGIAGALLNADMDITRGDGTLSVSETKFPAFNNCYT